MNSSSKESDWKLNPKPPMHYIEEGDNLVVKIYVNNEEINKSFNLENNTNSNKNHNNIHTNRGVDSSTMQRKKISP